MSSLGFSEEKLTVLLTESQIQTRIGEIAAELRAAYGEEPVLLVGILKGSLYFLADLSRHLGPEIEIDFLAVSSYGGEMQSSGVVQIRKDLDSSITGKHVLLVEDIVDTGLTLSYLRRMLHTRQPKSLRVVALLTKDKAMDHPAEVEFNGFLIPDEFVVGYGLDVAEKYRNLPFIATLQLGSSS